MRTLIILLVLLAAAPARAETEKALTITAKELYGQANDARDAQNWELCYAKAKAAWGAQRHPKIAAALGDCALDVGEAQESAEHLSFYLEHRSDKADPAFVSYVEERLAAAKSKIATVAIQLSVGGATVHVDGQPVEGKRTLFLDPGKHRFAAERPGFRTVERSLDLRAGEERVVELTLTPIEEPKQRNGDGGADIGLLGAGIGVLALGVGGVAVGIAGEVLRAGAASDHEEIRARIPDAASCGADSGALGADCNALSEAVDEHNQFRAMEVAGFAIGGAAVVAGAVMLGVAMATDEEPSNSSLRVAPVLGASTWGIAITATW